MQTIEKSPQKARATDLFAKNALKQNCPSGATVKRQGEQFKIKRLSAALNLIKLHGNLFRRRSINFCV
jgi:hypothetical protein